MLDLVAYLLSKDGFVKNCSEGTFKSSFSNEELEIIDSDLLTKYEAEEDVLEKIHDTDLSMDFLTK